MFWETENVGCDRRIAIEDDFESGIKFENWRYEVKMPFKDEHAILPDNYALSKTRLTNLMRKLKSNPSLAAEYQQVIMIFYGVSGFKDWTNIRHKESLFEYFNYARAEEFSKIFMG